MDKLRTILEYSPWINELVLNAEKAKEIQNHVQITQK